MRENVNIEFSEVWGQTAAKVKAYIFCLCRDKGHVDDLTQECYLRAFRNWDQLENVKSRQAWLFIIAKRTFLDWLRTKRDKFVGLDDIDELQEKVSEVYDSDDIDAVWNQINTLQPEYKDILYLRFAAGLGYAEMAEALDVPIGTVRSRLHRGLKALKTKF